MRLLVDEMYWPLVAEQLRDEHRVDAVSVHELAEVRGRPDEEVFELAQLQGRTVVTENVADFRPLFNAQLAEGRHHGVIYTTDSTYPRAKKRTIGALVRALAALNASAESFENREHWL